MATKPLITTKTEAERFLNEYRKLARQDRLAVCCHGHFDCSTEDGGPCMDETLANFPEFDE